MPNAVRGRLTYANVVSTLCLFILLGGSAAAAVSLTRNSVKGKHLARNAVTSPKVKNGTLRAKDFAPGQLPAGATGPQGAQGPQGLQGIPGPAGSARAWGHVLSTGALQVSQGVKSVTRRSSGIFCIVLDDSIDPDATTIIATPEMASNTTSETMVHVEASRQQVGSDCIAGGGGIPDTDFVVRTLNLENDSVDDDDGGGNGPGDNLSLISRDFSFLVP